MRPFLSGYLPVGWDLTVGLLLMSLSVSRACFGRWENLKARFKAEMFGADFKPVHLLVLRSQEGFLAYLQIGAGQYWVNPR